MYLKFPLSPKVYVCRGKVASGNLVMSRHLLLPFGLLHKFATQELELSVPRTCRGSSDRTNPLPKQVIHDSFHYCYASIRAVKQNRRSVFSMLVDTYPERHLSTLPFCVESVCGQPELAVFLQNMCRPFALDVQMHCLLSVLMYQ